MVQREQRRTLVYTKRGIDRVRSVASVGNERMFTVALLPVQWIEGCRWSAIQKQSYRQQSSLILKIPLEILFRKIRISTSFLLSPRYGI